MDISRSADIAGDPWMYQMRQGNFEEAWKISTRVLDSRKEIPCSHLPRHLQYVWDGSAPDGKRVLIRCYHGLGDTIQFIRYVSLLKKIATEVIVWAQPALLELLATVKGIDRLLPLHDGIPEAVYDLDVEIMELPHLFKTTGSTIPSEIPYLHVEPLYLHKDRETAAVGLVWQAGDWDKKRSVPFSLLKKLTNIKGVHFYMLQAGALDAGWDKLTGVHPGEFSIHEYASILKGLDLLITVDSMPAHLAGALGVPVWTLLQKNADWRWMEQRADSPWYPTMRLFRQKEQGAWEPVLEKVEFELNYLFNKSGKSEKPIIHSQVG